MSSFPTHRDNVHHAKELGLNIVDYTDQEDDFDSWNYDILVEVCSELLNRVQSLQNQLSVKEMKMVAESFNDTLGERWK